ncbi:MAG: class I SAM-dependent methyltransferase [Candidatus Glassbacteria bacterium]|nr:class I SAM-dependent methyltransferase [Candidatus Glassbacteria bacterium]
MEKENEKQYFVNSRYWTWEEMSAQLDSALAGLETGKTNRLSYAMDWVEGDTVLDVGCQRGVYSYYLAKNGKKVVGVEVDRTVLEIAERKFTHPNLSFKSVDGTRLDLPAESFDCALLLEVLEHTYHPRGLIREVHRVLKPGGTLIVSVPNAASYHTLARSLFLPTASYFAEMETWPDFATDQRDHYYYWDAFTLYRLLNRQGFGYRDHRYVDSRRVFRLLSKVLPPLRKMSTSFMIKVSKQES